MSMSSDQKRANRNWMKNNPGHPPQMREYFQELDANLSTSDIWVTTTTTSTSSSSSSSSSSTTSTTN